MSTFGCGFVFICIIISGVFYDQSDDIVESILGISAEFATKINVVSTPKDDISKLVLLGHQEWDCPTVGEERRDAQARVHRGGGRCRLMTPD